MQQRTFGDSTYYAILKSVYLIGNGDLIFIGESGYDHPGPYGYDITWATRTDSGLNSPPIGIRELNHSVTLNSQLLQNYPNPFNPITNIKFIIPKRDFVSLKIYDLLGREVFTLVDQVLNAGIYEFDWNGINYSSGVYFYRLVIDGQVINSLKMILLR